MDSEKRNHLMLLSRAMSDKRKSIRPKISIKQLCNSIRKKQIGDYSNIEHGKQSFTIDTFLSYLEGIKEIKRIDDKKKFKILYGYHLEQNRYRRPVEITRNQIRDRSKLAYSNIWAIETGISNYKIDSLIKYLIASNIIIESPELINHIINFINTKKL